MITDKLRPSSLRSWRDLRPVETGEHVLDEILASWPLRTWRRQPDEMAWSPAIEMYEKPDTFVVRVELPGVRQDEIDVSVTDNTLTVKGDREVPKEGKDEQYHRCEFRYGSFLRSMTMPAAIDVDEIGAVYEDGVLELNLPKTKDAKAARVQIRPREN